VFQGSVAQIKTDSSGGPEVLVESFVISGTQSIDSAELAGDHKQHSRIEVCR
jgi:hypothetical protein